MRYLEERAKEALELARLLDEIADEPRPHILGDREVLSLCMIAIMLNRIHMTLVDRLPYNHDYY